MTIEEAIQHCRGTALSNAACGTAYRKGGQTMLADGCEACAAEHAQLAEWLEELRQRRDLDQPARWLQRKRNGYAVLVCSACEKQKEGNARTAYCPNCGRPMTGEEGQE